jgi:branched-chain amino acid transport system permease protein
MERSAPAPGLWERYKYLLLALPIAYIVLLLGQPAGFDIPKIIDTIRADPSVILQQLINGLATGAIIAIIALGYTLVYGIIELVNFANGDVFMLGAMAALLALAPFIIINENGGQTAPWWAALLGFIPAMAVGALLNWGTERVAYRRLRNSPKLVILISAIGMSFILQNIGLQIASFGKLANLGGGWTVFGVFGSNNAAPKSFPAVLSDDNLLDYIIPPPPAPTAGPDAAGAPSGDRGRDHFDPAYRGSDRGCATRCRRRRAAHARSDPSGRRDRDHRDDRG